MQAMPGSKARDAQGGAGRQLVAQSAPTTPAQPSRQLLRAPKGACLPSLMHMSNVVYLMAA